MAAWSCVLSEKAAACAPFHASPFGLTTPRHSTPCDFTQAAVSLSPESRALWQRGTQALDRPVSPCDPACSLANPFPTARASRGSSAHLPYMAGLARLVGQSLAFVAEQIDPDFIARNELLPMLTTLNGSALLQLPRRSIRMARVTADAAIMEGQCLMLP